MVRFLLVVRCHCSQVDDHDASMCGGATVDFLKFFGDFSLATELIDYSLLPCRQTRRHLDAHGHVGALTFPTPPEWPGLMKGIKKRVRSFRLTMSLLSLGGRGIVDTRIS